LLIAMAAGLSLGIGLAITMDYRQMARVQYPASPAGPGPGMGPGGGYSPFQQGPSSPQGGQRFGPPPGGQTFGVPREDAARSSGAASETETGLAKLRTMVTGRRPLVRDPRVMTETPAQAPFFQPGRAPATAAAGAVARDTATGQPGYAAAFPGTHQPGVAAQAVNSIDPRELLAGIVADLANGRMRRLILTALLPTAQKTELAMTLARAAAARGHAVLVIDGDGRERALSRMSMREGLPARIHFDQMQINVLGIPCVGDGVVFVLPLEAVTGNMDLVDMPFIDVRLGAVLVDGPALGPELLGFNGIADTCLVLDERGYLTSMGLAQAAEHATAGIAAAAAPDMDPRRFAQTQFTSNA
jgi:Mrp family chromosome partitioning ATPase